MVSNAIQRVLGDTHRRLAIGSLSDLKREYEVELAEHGAEIAAQVDRIFAGLQETTQRIAAMALRKHRACEACGGPIEGARRMSRWYCSDRCRQRAYRQRHAGAA